MSYHKIKNTCIKEKRSRREFSGYSTENVSVEDNSILHIESFQLGQHTRFSHKSDDFL